MASGSADERSPSPTRSVPTGDTVATGSSTSSSSERHTHELTIVDCGGQTKVIKIKFKDHRRATSDGNKILFNLDNLGVQPGGPLASFIGKYVGECARIWTY
ncbi:hypothetical protein LINPERHAP2_LOCUS13714, partial [Linum perenne]